MLSRAPALRRLGLVCLVATLGCKPEPAPTTNPEPQPDAGGPTASAEVDTSEAAAAPEEPDEFDTPAETDDTDDDPEPEEAGEGAGGGEPVVAAKDPELEKTDGEKAKPDKPEKKERPPLPKPTHKLSGAKCQQSFAVGSKVKGFRLPSVDGKKTISPGAYRNRVMLLNFWGTWCKPCLKELPEFDRLYRKYRKNGLTLVAVATDEEPEQVQEFIDKHKLRAKVALEGEAAAGSYNRPNFPFTFVVNGQGKIVAAYEYIDNSCMGDLEQVIRDELEKLDR
jgi:peroxiredoxin